MSLDLAVEAVGLSAVALFVLGFRHGFDADHLAALSSLISKRRQSTLDAVGIGGAFSFGHMLSAIVFGLIGALLGLSIEALTPTLLESSAGVLAGVLVIVLGVWIVKGCVSGNCYEKRARYKMITFNLPNVELPRWVVFRLPILGPLCAVGYRAIYKILFACSICLSNWIGFLFSISPPVAAVGAFLISLATGNLLNGIFLVAVYGLGLFISMVIIGASEGKLFEILHRKSITIHNRAIGILGGIVLAFGVWFLMAQLVPVIPAPWEHY